MISLDVNLNWKFLNTRVVIVKWSHMYPWCTALRGWRIQWSIVPEVSEQVVSKLSLHLINLILFYLLHQPLNLSYCLMIRNWRWSFWLTCTRTMVSSWCQGIFTGQYVMIQLRLHFVFQEPPKEDLTVSEKFQLVLDVAQKAQVNLFITADTSRHLIYIPKPELWQ